MDDEFTSYKVFARAVDQGLHLCNAANVSLPEVMASSLRGSMLARVLGTPSLPLGDQRVARWVPSTEEPVLLAGTAAAASATRAGAVLAQAQAAAVEYAVEYLKQSAGNQLLGWGEVDKAVNTLRGCSDSNRLQPRYEQRAAAATGCSGSNGPQHGAGAAMGCSGSNRVLRPAVPCPESPTISSSVAHMTSALGRMTILRSGSVQQDYCVGSDSVAIQSDLIIFRQPPIGIMSPPTPTTSDKAGGAAEVVSSIPQFEESSPSTQPGPSCEKAVSTLLELELLLCTPPAKLRRSGAV